MAHYGSIAVDLDPRSKIPEKLLGSEDKAFPDPRLGSAVDPRSLFLESWILDPDQLLWIHSVLERLSTPGNLPKPPLPGKGIQGRPKLFGKYQGKWLKVDLREGGGTIYVYVYIYIYTQYLTKIADIQKPVHQPWSQNVLPSTMSKTPNPLFFVLVLVIELLLY